MLSNRPSEGALIGPSQSGISGVGLLWPFLLTAATLVHAFSGAPRVGNEAADCCDSASRKLIGGCLRRQIFHSIGSRVS